VGVGRCALVLRSVVLSGSGPQLPVVAAGSVSGYRDHGPPGERARYHRGYYAAYVLDPDGNNIEVVNHHRV
jgi:hypothetical protein